LVRVRKHDHGSRIERQLRDLAGFHVRKEPERAVVFDLRHGERTAAQEMPRAPTGDEHGRIELVEQLHEVLLHLGFLAAL
jgi:hypothetical protein